MPWIEANGASLRYELTGSGKDTLVLMHEAGGCLESYADALPGLEKAFRVLRYDQRGFGFSEKVRELTFDGVVADLAGLLDALKIAGPVHVAGCAMGSDFSSGFAARRSSRCCAAASSPAGCIRSVSIWRHAAGRSSAIQCTASRDGRASPTRPSPRRCVHFRDKRSTPGASG